MGICIVCAHARERERHRRHRTLVIKTHLDKLPTPAAISAKLHKKRKIENLHTLGFPARAAKPIEAVRFAGRRMWARHISTYTVDTLAHLPASRWISFGCGATSVYVYILYTHQSDQISATEKSRRSDLALASFLSLALFLSRYVSRYEPKRVFVALRVCITCTRMRYEVHLIGASRSHAALDIIQCLRCVQWLLLACNDWWKLSPGIILCVSWIIYCSLVNCEKEFSEKNLFVRIN